MLEKPKSLERLTIFKNAYYIYSIGQVRITDRIRNKVYLEVQDAVSEDWHSVIVSLDEESRVIKLMCDCTNASLRSKHLPLCSHMITAVTYCMFNLGRPKKK